MSEKFTGLPGRRPSGSPDLSNSLGGGVRPGRLMLFGCGGLLFLLGVAAIVFLLKADDFVGWVFGAVEDAVVERLPPDLPAADRHRLELAFDGAIGRLSGGDGDPEALSRLQSELTAILRSSDEAEPLTRDQVAEITAALEAVAGTARDPDAPPVAVPGAGSGPDSDRP